MSAQAFVQNNLNNLFLGFSLTASICSDNDQSDVISMTKYAIFTWWRHQMKAFSALLAFCVGNSPVTGEYPAKSQWRGALMFSLTCTWINGWVNKGEAGDLRRYRAHYGVTVMLTIIRTVVTSHNWISTPLTQWHSRINFFRLTDLNIIVIVRRGITAMSLLRNKDIIITSIV